MCHLAILKASSEKLMSVKFTPKCPKITNLTLISTSLYGSSY